MNVFVTGGTGFTGSHVVPLLLKNEYKVRCLYRPTSDRSVPLRAQPEIEWTLGDISDSQALSASMQGADALINIASLGFGHADSIIRAAQNAGIKRAIFISTTAIFTQLNAKSKTVRVAAERVIDVDDVAQAIVSCLCNDQTIGKSYNIAGKHPLTYNQVIDTISKQMNKHVWKVHIPTAPVVSLLRFFERLQIPFPIKAEQVLRLNENKDFSYAEALRDFGFSPLSFEDGIKLELKSV